MVGELGREGRRGGGERRRKSRGAVDIKSR